MWNIFLLTEPAEIQAYDYFSLGLQIFKRPKNKQNKTKQKNHTEVNLVTIQKKLLY